MIEFNGKCDVCDELEVEVQQSEQYRRMSRSDYIVFRRVGVHATLVNVWSS
jgi:hypothetical protein